MRKHFRVTNEVVMKMIETGHKKDDVIEYVKYPEPGDIINYRLKQGVYGEYSMFHSVEKTVKTVEPSEVKGYAWVTYEEGNNG